ncbi:MAG: Xaa-Pro peptidase family protein [Actinomycetota bacterium]|nr:Xaa-Pro peptidase family protein [Actinomycetota bacterium]
MPATHESRRARLEALLSERGWGAALVSNLVNIRYLTGFTGSNGALLLMPGAAPVFATDGRYLDQGADQTALVPYPIKGGATPALWSQVADAVGADAWQQVQTVAVETNHLTHDDFVSLDGAKGHCELVPLDGLVEARRRVKDEEEIANLREACEISTQALETLLAGELLGRSERQLTRALEASMLDLGAEAVGFDTIMAGGPHSAVPHHSPTDRAVARGDLLTIDFGARVRGYHADCTRTFVVGQEPADWQREAYAAVREAQAVGVAQARPRAATGDVDAAVVECLRGHGLAERFVHGLGHGVGLEIHEDPFMGAVSTGILADCDAITIEPGVYLPGRGGVRIEDTLVVRPDGAEVLTTAPKDLRVVG